MLLLHSIAYLILSAGLPPAQEAPEKTPADQEGPLDNDTFVPTLGEI